MKKLLIAAAIVLSALMVTAPEAKSGVSIGIGIGFPGYGYPGYYGFPYAYPVAYYRPVYYGVGYRPYYWWHGRRVYYHHRHHHWH